MNDLMKKQIRLRPGLLTLSSGLPFVRQCTLPESGSSDLFGIIVMTILPPVHVYFMYRQSVSRFLRPIMAHFARRDSRSLRFSCRFSNEALQLTAVCVESAHNGGHLRAYLAIRARLSAGWRVATAHHQHRDSAPCTQSEWSLSAHPSVRSTPPAVT